MRKIFRNKELAVVSAVMAPVSSVTRSICQRANVYESSIFFMYAGSKGLVRRRPVAYGVISKTTP